MANQKKKAQEMAKREAAISSQPTIYTFNFRDVPGEKYAETLDVLFRNPDFISQLDNRNNLVNTAARIRANSPEMMSLIKAIQQRDRKLADLVYACIVQANIHSDVTFDFLSFNTLLKYYVDYSKEGMNEKENELAANLDKLTFLSDMLESILTDIKGEMYYLFGRNIEFQQFDGVMKTLQQLRGYFMLARSKDDDSAEAQIYFDYADSINEYMYKRMKTYSEKVRKLKPRIFTYSAEQMADAVNLFFDADKHWGAGFIQRTENGGAYIDAVKLAFNLSKSQTQKLDKAMASVKQKTTAEKDPLKYSFLVTDVIMLYYRTNNSK